MPITQQSPMSFRLICVSRPFALGSQNNADFEDLLIIFPFGNYMEPSECRTESMTSLT